VNDAFLPPEAALDLTRAILARTSGSPCRRLRDLACAFVDGGLESGSESLVRAHLETCPGCAALVSALAASQRVLPRLAHLDPGPWFTQRVLRATVHQRAQPSTWWKLMHRPRIALEAAYLGATAGLLGLSLPLPSTGLAAKVPALVQPLGASVQRVAGQVVQAEQRSARSLQQGLLPKALLAKAPEGSGSLWQRLSTQLKVSLRRFHKAPQPPARPEEKAPRPANP
jgi:anti-sigma factor RsiW